MEAGLLGAAGHHAQHHVAAEPRLERELVPNRHLRMAGKLVQEAPVKFLRVTQMAVQVF